MEARHPHIFGDAGASPGWEALKAGERAHKGTKSALDGVAEALPALMRADKLQRRAARAGFDWPDPQGPADKVAEEIAELAEAGADKRAEEAGDLLFAAVNLVRAYGIAPEDALRRRNASSSGDFGRWKRWPAVRRTSPPCRSTSRRRCGSGSRPAKARSGFPTPACSAYVRCMRMPHSPTLSLSRTEPPAAMLMWPKVTNRVSGVTLRKGRQLAEYKRIQLLNSRSHGVTLVTLP